MNLKKLSNSVEIVVMLIYFLAFSAVMFSWAYSSSVKDVTLSYFIIMFGTLSMCIVSSLLGITSFKDLGDQEKYVWQKPFFYVLIFEIIISISTGDDIMTFATNNNDPVASYFTEKYPDFVDRFLFGPWFPTFWYIASRPFYRLKHIESELDKFTEYKYQRDFDKDNDSK